MDVYFLQLDSKVRREFSNILGFLFLLTSLLGGCTEPVILPPAPPSQELIRAADLSLLPTIEAEDSLPGYFQGDPLVLLQAAGLNAVRLRIWHNPATAQSSLEEVKGMASRVHAAGLAVWLTVHYSDTWADPGQQETPQAWQGVTFPNLKDSFVAYTQLLLEEIQPEIIQIGNEINAGILHPEGHFYSNQDQFLELLQAATGTIRAYDPETRIMLHYAGPAGATAFFDALASLDYDQIGISYYPLYHGKDLDGLQLTLTELRERFGKEVVIAETAYPFTLGWNDYTQNLVGLEEQLILPGYPATPEGQRAFMLRIREIVEAASGSGFAYWGGEWISYQGDTATNGSPWENQALFDFDGAMLPVAEVFQR